MSDRVFRAAGIILLSAALALVLIPAFQAERPRPDAIRASGREYRALAAEMPSGTVSVNTADLYELTELPGIGETLSALIIRERDGNGPFYYPEDLLSVKGIGVKKLEQFRGMLNLE